MTELKHFYSYATGVSLELPVGFTQVSETDTSVAYALREDDDTLTDSSPALEVRVVGGVPADDPDGRSSVSRLADQFAAGGTPLLRRDAVIDECPVTTVEVERDGHLLHLSAAAADGRLISLAARGPQQSAPVWEAAINSLRFITL